MIHAVPNDIKREHLQAPNPSLSSTLSYHSDEEENMINSSPPLISLRAPDILHSFLLIHIKH